MNLFLKIMKGKNSHVFFLKKVGGALIRVGALNRDYMVPNAHIHDTHTHTGLNESTVFCFAPKLHRCLEIFEAPFKLALTLQTCYDFAEINFQNAT